MLRDKKFVPKFSWITIAVSSFAVIALIADIFGVNPLRSIWSNFERMEGWMAIIHAWAYFMVIGAVFIEKKLWQRFFNISLIAAACVSLYGFIQLGGGAMIHQGSTRIDASLGNAIYLAVYMLFHTFIALYLLAIAWGKKHYGMVTLYGILALIFVFMIFETATRGTLIGLVGGGLVTLLVLTIFDKTHKTLRVVSGSLIGLVIILGVLFYTNKDAGFIQKNETLRRMASISWQDTKTQARGFIWPMAINEVFDSPKTAIIGLGQENFNYIFNENYNPKMWNQEQWFDRVHNIYLDWLVAGGLLGLISYLALFVFSLISVWKADISIKERAVLLGLLVAYGIHNFFVFDNLVSYVFFFSILAFAHFLSGGASLQWIEKRIHLHKENFVIVRDYLVFPLMIIVFFVTLYFINVRPVQANLRLVESLRACVPQNSIAKITESYKKALALDQSMSNQEIREQLIHCGETVANGQYSGADKQQFLDYILAEVENQISETPNDARIYTLAGGFFNVIGNRIQAERLLTKAHELSPRKQSISLQLASMYVNASELDKALELFKQAYEGDPTYENAKTAYLSTLVISGKEEEAKKIFGNDPALYENVQIAQLYVSFKNYPKAIALLKKLLVQNPKNLEAGIRLAQTQYMAGLKYDAIATLRQVAVNNPELKAEIDLAIKDIETQTSSDFHK